MPVPFCRYLDKPPVFTDATPTQIGLCMPHTKHFVLFESHNRVIENDFFSIFLVHILFPNSVLVNDNIPAIFLFRRGKLPQSLLDNFLLNLLIIELIDDNKMIIMYCTRFGESSVSLCHGFWKWKKGAGSVYIKYKHNKNMCALVRALCGIPCIKRCFKREEGSFTLIWRQIFTRTFSGCCLGESKVVSIDLPNI